MGLYALLQSEHVMGRTGGSRRLRNGTMLVTGNAGFNAQLCPIEEASRDPPTVLHLTRDLFGIATSHHGAPAVRHRLLQAERWAAALWFLAHRRSDGRDVMLAARIAALGAQRDDLFVALRIKPEFFW